MAATSQHGTLTAGVVTTVTISGNHKGFRVQRAGSGTADLWWSWSTATPATPTTAGADDSYRIQSGEGPDIVDDDIRNGFTVKLISSDALGYSVEAW